MGQSAKLHREVISEHRKHKQGFTRHFWRTFLAENTAGAKAWRGGRARCAGKRRAPQCSWGVGRGGDSHHMTEGSVHQARTY